MKARFWIGVLVGVLGTIVLALVVGAVVMWSMGRCPMCGSPMQPATAAQDPAARADLAPAVKMRCRLQLFS